MADVRFCCYFLEEGILPKLFSSKGDRRRHVTKGYEMEEGLLAEFFKESDQITGDGSVNFLGNPAIKERTGGLMAGYFVIGTQFWEGLAYGGMSANLIGYLTKMLHMSKVSAAREISLWNGACYVTSLVGAIIADGFLGRYLTTVVFSIVYLIGMLVLTLSASVPPIMPQSCKRSVCKPANPYQYCVFLFGLYLVACGTGVIKSCISAFGADQFDDTDPAERTLKGYFFDSFYAAMSFGAAFVSVVMIWVQDNLGWGLGFGIPTGFMVLAIISFWSGKSCYRFRKPAGSPVTRICQVVVASLRKWNSNVPDDSTLLYELPDGAYAIDGNQQLEHTEELRFLDKAATITDLDVRTNAFTNPWRLCTITQVEELKILLRMFPIWATTILFATVFAQMSNMFVEQGMLLDPSFGPLKISPEFPSRFGIATVIVCVILYGKMPRRFSGNQRSFIDLQRMGIGLAICILSMSAAAILEFKRLAMVREEHLVDEDVPTPLSILWQIPQCVLVGASGYFTSTGAMEFFYDQSPDTMRSLCTAMQLVTTGLAHYLSAFIMTVVVFITSRGGNPGWIPGNLNEGHLDYFFWLMAGLGFLNLLLYIFCAKRFRSRPRPT